MTPYTTMPAWPEVRPGRYASTIIRTDSANPSLDTEAFSEGCHVALLGLADDLGVSMNFGRPGARHGPAAFRAALARYGVATPHPPPAGSIENSAGSVPLPRLFDAGDVEPGDSLNETHERVSAAVEHLVQIGYVPVGIGGGHDLTFPFVRGVMRRGTPAANGSHRARQPGERSMSAGHAAGSLAFPLAPSTRPTPPTPASAHGSAAPARASDGGAAPCRASSGVYLDAHLDVRAEAGSGMGFRKLIEECGVTSLTCVGFDEFANAGEHVEWFLSHGGSVVAAEEAESALRRVSAPGAPMFVSIDLDCLDAAHAPGVSAINPCGMTPAVVGRFAYEAGRSADVRCLDIMELNPAHDADGRTARIAAHLLLRFLRGFAER